MITDHPPVTAWAVPFFVVTLAVEAWWLHRRARGYDGRDASASLALGVISLAVGLVIAAVDVPISLFAWEHRFWDLGTGVVAWIVAMVAWDLAFYWYHRAGHRVRFLWANHVQHHSSERYHLATALRQPVTSFSEWLFFPVLAILGVPPWIIFAAGGINLVYQYWLHTETIGRLPRWFEAVFNTPSHHRAHHGSNQRYLDRNYGGILIVWDRLFGTFEPEGEPVVYGLTTNIGTSNVWRVITHEYAAMGRDVRSAARWRDKVGHVLRPPGWTPSGTVDRAASSVAAASTD